MMKKYFTGGLFLFDHWCLFAAMIPSVAMKVTELCSCIHLGHYGRLRPWSDPFLALHGF